MGNELICSLDIGTRTIIGLVGEYIDGEKFKVVAYAKKEHKKRNMYDGQIHDIVGVSVTVKEVIEELEQKINGKLNTVSIAAAGRSLRTHKIKIEREIESDQEISRRQIDSLELEAVQIAKKKLNEEKNEHSGNLDYYNIGYTVNSYFLDSNKIETLFAHKGSSIGVELLCTFLPQVVIESLYSVIATVGLEIASITLEPIAAINVAIKEDLRLLNLVLVDIGAGTSDIAITKEGEIIAYGMTQLAGDEITESLSRAYLLDFKSSERLKIELSEKEEHEFVDIVGISHKLHRSEIVGKINAVIEKIAKEITDEILKYNNKSPDAVFLIGGSSQMPMLKEKIAKNLGLSNERISIRDTSFIENIEGLDNLIGPDMVTPIGIAIEAVDNKYKNFIKIIFNGEKIRIFNTDDIKVSDVLILTGYNPRNLISNAGEAFTYYINNKKRKIIGELASPPQILINGIRGDLRTQLIDGDTVDIKEYKPKNPKAPFLYSIIEKEKNIIYNKQEFNLLKEVKINGNIIESDILLEQNDCIEIQYIRTIDEFLEAYKIESENKKFFINDLNVKDSYELRKGDYLEIVNSLDDNKSKNIEGQNTKNTIKLTINDDEVEIRHTKENFVFVDIFDYIDFDRSAVKGKLVLKVNGKDAEYLEKLSDGDNIKIYWQ